MRNEDRRPVYLTLRLIGRALLFPVRLVLGFDVFISYARADATEYAGALAWDLAQIVSPRIDQQGTNPGETPDWLLHLEVMLSRVLVVLNSPGAAASRHVADEVKTFVGWGGGTIVPVELDFALENATWYGEIFGVTRIRESASAVVAGKPSPEVASQIARAVGFWKLSRRQLLATCLFLAVLTSLGYATYRTSKARKSALADLHQAQQDTLKARQDTTKAEAETTRQEALAAAARNEADLQGGLAEQRKREAALYLAQSESRSLASEARRRTDETLPYSVGLNTLLALAAAQRNQTPEAIDAVRETARLLPLSVKRFDHNAQPVGVAAVSPDGQMLATVSYGLVRIFDRWQGSEIAQCCDKTMGDVEDIAWNPENLNQLAIGAKQVGLFDVKARKILWQKGKYSDPRVKFSKHGTYIGVTEYIAFKDKHTTVYRTRDGDEVFVSPHGDEGALDFSGGEEMVAVGGNEGCARIYTLPDGKPKIDCVPASKYVIESVSFSPDDKMLATGGGDQKLRVFNLEQHTSTELSTESDYIKFVKWSPDGNFIALAAANYVRLMTKDGTTLAVQQQGHVEDTHCTFAFSPDSQLIATGGGDALIHVLETLTGREVQRYPQGEIFSLSFSPDGRYLASGHHAGRAEIIELPRKDFSQWLVPMRGVTALRLLPDGEKVLVAQEDRTIKLYAARTGKPAGGKAELLVPAREAIDISSDLSTIAVGWDGAAVLSPPRGSQDSIRLAHSEDDPTIGIFIGASRLVAIAAERAEYIAQLPWQNKWEWNVRLPAHAVALDPTGNVVATGSTEGRVFVENWRKDPNPNRRPSHESLVDFLDHEPYEMTHTPLRTGSFAEQVNALVFSSDGRYLATGGTAGRAVVFDLEHRSQVAVVPFPRPIQQIAFIDHDRRILIIDSKHSFRTALWQPADVLSDACNRVDTYTGLALKEIPPEGWKGIVPHMHSNPCDGLPTP